MARMGAVPYDGDLLATGGDVTFNGGYIYHTFTESGIFEVNSVAGCEVLIVAGGGGGGNSYYSGGGGAGGLLQITKAVPPGSYPIIIGAGGVGGNICNTATQGGDTTIFDQVAKGGGFGGGGHSCNTGPSIGGSGGGGATVGNRTGASGIIGQGNSGGNASEDTHYCAGGGGGAGTPGTVGLTNTTVSNGGEGLNVWGNWYAAGGAGYSHFGPSVWTNRQNGVGGASVCNQYNPPDAELELLNGVINTGSGGGGYDRRLTSNKAGNGSSGIVIVRYPG